LAWRVYVLEYLHGTHDVEAPFALAGQQVFSGRVLVAESGRITGKQRVTGSVLCCYCNTGRGGIDAQDVGTESGECLRANPSESTGRLQASIAHL
jgi:hypothetical protein